MTPAHQEILDAMTPGEPITAKQIARIIGGTAAPHRVAPGLVAMRRAGLVDHAGMTPHPRTHLWVRLLPVSAPEPDRYPGTVVKQMQLTAPAHSSSESIIVGVRLPAAPWEVRA